MSNPVLVGIRKFVSRKGENFMVMQMTKEFNQRELGGGSVGLAVQEEFVPAELFEAANRLEVGKPIKIDYEVNGRKAYIVGLETVDEK